MFLCAAVTPPVISVSPLALSGIYEAASSVTVVASPRAGLTIIDITYKEHGIIVSTQKVSSSSLMLTWTPTERHLSGNVSLHVTAVDSNGDSATITIPITLCNCRGACQPHSSIALTETYTELTCLSCEAGKLQHLFIGISKFALETDFGKSIAKV